MFLNYIVLSPNLLRRIYMRDIYRPPTTKNCYIVSFSPIIYNFKLIDKHLFTFNLFININLCKTQENLSVVKFKCGFLFFIQNLTDE